MMSDRPLWLGEPETATLINPGFSTADADYPEIHLLNGELFVRFQDWQEKTIEVVFVDTIAHHWQSAEILLEGERNDSCYEISHSRWRFDHVQQGVIDSIEDCQHYRFNFNTCGQLEVLARSYRLVTVEIDLSKVMTTSDLHLELARALDFPDFYGQNWNAFWDAITGLVEMPRVLRFHGWEAFSDRLPRDAQMLRQCLDDMQREYPTLAAQVEYV
jgi:RNAse (barnase) inhibitor barstar